MAVELLARHPAHFAPSQVLSVGFRFARGASTRVEYLIRPARITDIDRLVALGGGSLRPSAAAGALDSGDLLRQLVYLPQASIFIAEARRDVVGGAVLALRPSVRAGGFVGVVDFIVVDPSHDADRVTDALLEELIRSARNKGCSLVEAALPDDPAERTRLERHGFVESGPRAECRVAAVGATGARGAN
jgi:GNAT superfamily N-acetyltransferase